MRRMLPRLVPPRRLHRAILPHAIVPKPADTGSAKLALNAVSY